MAVNSSSIVKRNLRIVRIFLGLIIGAVLVLSILVSPIFWLRSIPGTKYRLLALACVEAAGIYVGIVYFFWASHRELPKLFGLMQGPILRRKLEWAAPEQATPDAPAEDFHS